MERNERYQSATEYRPRTARPAAASGRNSGATRAAEAVRRSTGSRAAAPNRPKKRKKNNRAGIVLGVVCALVVVLGCVAGYLYFSDGGAAKPSDNKILNNVYVLGTNLGGMTKQEAQTTLEKLSLDQDMNVIFYTHGAYAVYKTSFDPSSVKSVDIYGNELDNAQQTVAVPKDESAPDDPKAPVDENGKPYVADGTALVLSADQANLSVDLTACVNAAYDYGRTSEVENAGQERVDLDIGKYMTLDEDYISQTVRGYLEEKARVGTETRVEKGTTTVTDADGNPQTVDCLNITLGTLGRKIDVDDLLKQIKRAYMTGQRADTDTTDDGQQKEGKAFERSDLQPFEVRAVYSETLPEAVDLDALYQEYQCVEPVNAVCDENTFEITDGKEGYGFRMIDAVAKFEGAKAGDTVTLTLTTIQPEYTREILENKLFADKLAYCQSPIVYNPTRTENLRLAAKAINGYILKPGATFSFNDVVGERTAEKGYGKAGVYVGGKTEQQLGGGICQVASTLYYCTLKADLEVVERAEHQYVPDYVPWGMDATIYWGYLDYQFRNNTGFPIRIETYVSDDGKYVYTTFVGTDTKEYTVELDYEVTSKNPCTTKTVDIYPEMANYDKYKDYYEGQTITYGYDGANVTTYRYKYDRNGTLISTEVVNYSKYDRRDQEVAHWGKPEGDDPTTTTTETPTTTTEPATEPPTTTEPPAPEPAPEPEP